MDQTETVTNGGSPGAELGQRHPLPLPVAIAGMHRSGTSMVAKLLQQAGLHLGEPEALMPPAEENPEGFFEHLEFVRLNDEVLNAAGAGWDCPPAPGVDWATADLQPFRERAQHLAETLAGSAPWGWKDPRTSLTLPFWRTALGPVRTIIVVRNPLEVVTSLHRRNGFSFALALTLWRIYAERVLSDTTQDDRLVTHYDAHFLEPGREIARLLPFVGLDANQQNPALKDAAAPQLRHHRKTIQDLIDHQFPPEVIALYRALCREAQWWEGGSANQADDTAGWAPSVAGTEVLARGTGAVDLLRVENATLRRGNDDYAAALADRDARIKELEIALQGHEVARSELEGKVAEREGRLHERHQVIARKDHAFAQLQHQLATTADQLAQARQQNSALREQLAASERARVMTERQERELRTRLTALHDVQLQRDAEIMGTLGAALSRYAPGAPAAIYHRKLVARVRQVVEARLPANARVLVATYGDPALLELGARQTTPFPRADSGVSADYTDISDEVAIAQLDALSNAGAEFLVVPGPALPWLINHPELKRSLDDRFSVIAEERGVVAIYALGRQGQIPA